MIEMYINCLALNNSQGGNAAEIFNSIFLKNTVTEGERVKLISGRQALVRRVNFALPVVTYRPGQFDTRNNRLLLHVAMQMKNQIETVIEKYGKQRVAVILGTSTSGILESEEAFKGKSTEKFNYYKQEISSPSEFLAGFFGLKGIHYTVSTACSSSAKVFIEAKRLIDLGLCDAAIVGGVDSLCSLTLDGFDSLDSVSPNITNAFSKNRNGINIGEGAALFIVSKEEAAIRLAGYGESSDAYHLSSPDPEGAGGEIAIQSALKMAKLQPDQISYINLHGTGTVKNDLMESHLVNRVFGAETPVSSTKAFIGHTLGAAGAQELALCYLALDFGNKQQKLPPHYWDAQADSDLAKLNFSTTQTCLKTKVCMSNSFAFGGNNVSLIICGA